MRGGRTGNEPASCQPNRHSLSLPGANGLAPSSAVGSSAARMAAMERTQPPASVSPAVDDEEDYDYTPEADPADAAPQVSSYIAIIRIVSVLIIGVSLSFGLFMTVVGKDGLIIGVPLILLTVPVYYAMQFAEKLAAGRQPGEASDDG